MLAPAASAQPTLRVDPSDWPVATCAGAQPFAQAYSIKPTSVQRLSGGAYSAIFLVGLSIHWAPPEPQTLGVSADRRRGV